jgi:16S rRNA G527 N7-methylase RsmG
MVSEDLSLILIESNLKKATFLAELVRELPLKNVDVRRCRMEDLELGKEKVDFITARALGIDDRFLEWSRNALDADGSVVLWLGEFDSSRVSQKMSWKWANPVRIPLSERRVILRGTKL